MRYALPRETNAPERWTSANPCPVCGGDQSQPRGSDLRCHGYRSSHDAVLVFCSQIPSSKETIGGLYRHRQDESCLCGSTHIAAEVEREETRRRRQTQVRAEEHDHDPAPCPPKEVEAEYPYLDPDGNHIFSVLRLKPKEFRQASVDRVTGDLTSRPGCMRGVELYPYRLPQLLRGIEDRREIWIVEGEADVHALVDLDLIATTNPGGAGKWRDDFSRWLKGADHLVISGDWDAAGRRHMAQVFRSVHRAFPDTEIEVRRCAIGCKDLREHCEAGHAFEDLEVVDPGELEITAPSGGSHRNLRVGSEALDRDTDFANAEVFVEMFGDKVRYVREKQDWAMYDPDRCVWRMHAGGPITGFAREVSREIDRTVTIEPDDRRRNDLRRRAKRIESARGAQAMLYFARGMLEISAVDFDADDNLLCCPNGVLNLHTFELEPHRPELLMTRQTRAVYDADARSEDVDSTYTRFLGDDQAFFFELMSLGLTGRQLKRFGVISGPTGCGKTSTLEPIEYALGDYAVSAHPDTFLSRKLDTGGNTPYLATLPGARLVLCYEMPPGKIFASPLVKAWTGGETLTAMQKHQPPIQFRPQGTLIFSGNDRPGIEHHERAMWARALTLDFTREIPTERRQDEFYQRLHTPENASAILNRLVEGLRRLANRGWSIAVPKSVEVAAEKYRDENDELGEFFQDHVHRVDAAVATVADAYCAYEDWCRNAGIRLPLTKDAFGKEMAKRGFHSKPKKVSGKTKRVYPGVQITRP